MPIYQYRCQDCSEVVETMQKVSDPPLTRCEACGKDSLKKLISAPGIIFKGSGFHKNDYTGKSGASSSSPSSDSAPKADAPAKSETPASGSTDSISSTSSSGGSSGGASA